MFNFVKGKKWRISWHKSDPVNGKDNSMRTQPERKVDLEDEGEKDMAWSRLKEEWRRVENGTKKTQELQWRDLIRQYAAKTGWKRLKMAENVRTVTLHSIKEYIFFFFLFSGHGKFMVTLFKYLNDFHGKFNFLLFI